MVLFHVQHIYPVQPPWLFALFFLTHMKNMLQVLMSLSFYY
jgi:hypothetical protein